MQSDDLIRMPCDEDLPHAGAAELTQALAHPARLPHLATFDRMRQRVADHIASLAFRRYLTAEQIPHETLPSANFTQPDIFDIAFGGRRVVVFAQLVCQRSLIQEMHQDPAQFLEGRAYISGGSDLAAYRDVDIYIFAFLTGLVTRSREDAAKAAVSGQPLMLLYKMPPAWSAPEKWAGLDPLALKTDISSPIRLTLHGQDARQGYLTQTLDLPPRERSVAAPGFFTLGALQTDTLPEGPIGVHSPAVSETLLVAPYQWGNVWVYPMRLYLAGYLSQADFNRQAEVKGGEEAARGNSCLRDETLASVPVQALTPVSDLFVRAANWARQKER